MVKINSFKGKYAWMSNFYNLKQPMLFEGVYYDNSEAAFQASKCTDINERKKFSKLNPSEAKALGRKVKMRPDWDTYRLECMHNVLVEKIKQILGWQMHCWRLVMHTLRRVILGVISSGEP